MFSPPTPHFYKIILDPNKLRFPRRFITNHGSELSSPVQLRVPDGLTFAVEVAESNGEVWLENGWQQFSEHYSLKYGHFVFFEYEGNCSFQVVIFDVSATEIDYPYDGDSDDGSDEECQQPSKDEEETHDDISAGILDQTQEPNEEEEEAKDNFFDETLNQSQETKQEEEATAKDNAFAELVNQTQETNREEAPTGNAFAELVNEMPLEMESMKKYCSSKKKRKTTSDEEEPQEITSVELEEILNQTPPVWETRKTYHRLRKKYRETTPDKEEGGGGEREEEYVETLNQTTLESKGDYPYISNRTDVECQLPNKDEEEINDDTSAGILYQTLEPNTEEEEAKDNTFDETLDQTQKTNQKEEATKDNAFAEIVNQTPLRWRWRKKHCASMKKRKISLDEEEPQDISLVELEEILNQTPPVLKTKKKYRRLRKKYRETSPDDGGGEEKEDKSVKTLGQTPPESGWKMGKEYSLHKRQRKSTSDMEEEDAKNNASVEMLNETILRNTYRPPKRKRMKKRKTTSDKKKYDIEDASTSGGDLQTKVVRGRHALGMEEHSTPLQRAGTFESDNPFFVVEMQPSYVLPGRKMVIPSNFTDKYLLKKADYVTLCTLGGKTWHASYLRYKTSNKYTRAVLCDGWRKFARDNELETGDVCVFELTKQTKILFKVAIYRVREDPNCCSSSGGMNSSVNCGNGKLSKQRSTKSKHLCLQRSWLTGHEKARALVGAKDFESENPYFKVVLQPAYIWNRWRLYIPYKFADTYLDEKKGQVILQDSEGSTWVVDFSILRTSSGQLKAQLSSGWKKFALENNLKVGDVCVFELIDCNKALFRVSVF